MIDSFNVGATGWARFSDDGAMRYRLARSLEEKPLSVVEGVILHDGDPWLTGLRVVFLMLNPSTADAFELDQTIKRCRKRAIAMGASVLEVVNLFAFRSTYPEDLLPIKKGDRGDDMAADLEILTACKGAHTVFAAWGNGGALDGRANEVCDMLESNEIAMWCLGLTGAGEPKHPLARGRAFIPDDFEPVRYTR